MNGKEDGEARADESDIRQRRNCRKPKDKGLPRKITAAYLKEVIYPGVGWTNAHNMAVCRKQFARIPKKLITKELLGMAALNGLSVMHVLCQNGNIDLLPKRAPLPIGKLLRLKFQGTKTPVDFLMEERGFTGLSALYEKADTEFFGKIRREIEEQGLDILLLGEGLYALRISKPTRLALALGREAKEMTTRGGGLVEIVNRLHWWKEKPVMAS